MAPFRRVDAEKAGPTAVGILVPAGAKTLTILRPRSLPWDLLPARWMGDGAPCFCSFTRDDASLLARRLVKSLEAAVLAGVNPVQTFGDAEGRAFQVWVRIDEWVWIVCARSPGQSYRPVIFSTREDATLAALQLSKIVWPNVGDDQELYFNTQQLKQ